MVLSALVVSFLDVPIRKEANRTGSPRPLMAIARQPTYLVAVIAATIGYGVMNLLMSATPLAMKRSTLRPWVTFLACSCLPASSR